MVIAAFRIVFTAEPRPKNPVKSGFLSKFRRKIQSNFLQKNDARYRGFKIGKFDERRYNSQYTDEADVKL